MGAIVTVNMECLGEYSQALRTREAAKTRYRFDNARERCLTKLRGLRDSSLSARQKWEYERLVRPSRSYPSAGTTPWLICTKRAATAALPVPGPHLIEKYRAVS